MAEYTSPNAVAIAGWVALCASLAPFSSILMFLSPIPTIRQILRNGTVGDLPLLPYTSMVASCFAWILYGIMKREPMIWGTNLVEFVLSVYYFVEFSNYAPKHSPTFPGSVYAHIKFCIGTSTGSVFISIFFSDAVTTIGDLTVALTILTFASPLAATKAVLESQSSESIPWPFTLAALFNCCLWSIVGIWEMNDFFVYSPAVIGLLFSLLQVSLKLHFGDRISQDNPTYTKSPVEMPYPLLGSVRQVVMLGSTTNVSTSYDNNMHELQFDNNMPDSDYVELGVPLSSSYDQSSQKSAPLSQQSFLDNISVSAQPHFVGPLHQKHRKSHDGLEYITAEGLHNIDFEGEDLPQQSGLRDSFRSRSSGGGGQGHAHGF